MTDRPIVLTGASGFLARHVLIRLLAGGHHVRATLRSPDRADEVRAAVLPQLAADAAARLSFVALDLTADEGWDAAMAGAGALIHTASPFPIAQPRDAAELIRPAVDGTLRALRAAHRAGVGRVVLTSSTVAIVAPGVHGPQDEDRWTDLGLPGVTPYARSKTMAERAAWDFVAGEGRGIALTAINPGLIVGPVLGRVLGSSAGLVRRMLVGRDPLQPRYGLPVVDARDVAAMHVLALSTPETEGQRIAAVAGSLWFREIAQVLRAAYPDRRIATREAPALLLRALGLFDAEVRSLLPRLGQKEEVSNARARRLFGIDFIPPDEAIRATARSLVALGLA